MPGARKAADLLRDPRVAVHSASADPSVWTGDAKLAGRAVHVTDPDTIARFTGSLDQGPPPGEFQLFRIDVTELVVVELSAAKGQAGHRVVARGPGHHPLRAVGEARSWGNRSSSVPSSSSRPYRGIRLRQSV